MEENSLPGVERLERSKLRREVGRNQAESPSYAPSGLVIVLIIHRKWDLTFIISHALLAYSLTKILLNSTGVLPLLAVVLG